MPIIQLPRLSGARKTVRPMTDKTPQREGKEKSSEALNLPSLRVLTHFDVKGSKCDLKGMLLVLAIVRIIPIFRVLCVLGCSGVRCAQAMVRS